MGIDRPPARRTVILINAMKIKVCYLSARFTATYVLVMSVLYPQSLIFGQRTGELRAQYTLDIMIIIYYHDLTPLNF